MSSDGAIRTRRPEPSFFRTLRVGLSRQISIVIALTLREFRIRNKKFAFAVWFDLLELVGMICFIALVAYFLQRKPPIGDSEIVFIASGMIPFFFFKTISIRTTSTARLRIGPQPIPDLTMLDSALAKAFTDIVMYTITMLVVIMLCYVFVESKYAIPFKPLVLIDALAVLFMFAFGVGLCNGLIRAYVPVWRVIWPPLARLQMLTCGVHQLPEYLPAQLRELAFMNPLTHMVAYGRSSFYPMYPSYFIDMGYALKFAFGALIIGLAAQQVFRHRLAAH